MLKVANIRNASQYNTEDLKALLDLISRHPMHYLESRQQEVELAFVDYRPKAVPVARDEFGLCFSRNWSSAESAGTIRRIQLLSPSIFKPSDIEILASTFALSSVPRDWILATARTLRELYWRHSAEYSHDYRNKSAVEKERAQAFFAEVGELRIEKSLPEDSRFQVAKINFEMKSADLHKKRKTIEACIARETTALKDLESRQIDIESKFEAAKAKLAGKD